jgi:endonuclease-3
MLKKVEKIAFISQTLDRLFPDPPIPLDHSDPFTLLVAVLLSAQCTDAMVNRVTPALFRRAPDPFKMSQLAPEEILSIISSCGLAPTKAKNIHALSRILVERYQGVVPASFEELESFPGVGHKTASVVMSHAFQVPAFPVDTHIHRLATRWGLSDGSSVEKTEADLKRLFPKKRWELLHLQIIYFGRKYCPARNHDPLQCPICSVCAR